METGKQNKESELEPKEDLISSNTIVFNSSSENPEEVLKFTRDKMFLRGKETECPQDIIDGMRAWLRQWNYIGIEPTDNGPVTICKKEGDLVAIIDNEDLVMRLQVNPWTLKVTDFQYNLPKEDIDYEQS